MGEHIYTYDDPPSERDIQKACKILEAGGVIAYPGSHNWAFACDSAAVKALNRIHLLKPHHPKDRPFSLICSSIAMASEYAMIDHHVYRSLKKAWPGPFTVILTRSRNLPKQIKDKRPVVGIRIPKSPLLLALIEAFARPLASTSIPQKEYDGRPVTMGWQLQEIYGHAIDLVLDLGQELPGLESTVIDFSDDEPILVRKGVGDPSLFGIEES
jgi:tRNA threonylcarbamoyl adenosine modification protein (Sua5/YciO/YrdC/YwlC family)